MQVEPYDSHILQHSTTPQVETLVKLIGKNTYSVKEMMALVDFKNRENFMDTYLNPSIEANLVEPLYPEQPNHPRQKYLLTEIGKALLE